MSRQRRFSLPMRALGSVCAISLLGVLIVFAVAGFGWVSGLVFAASVTGLVAPAMTVSGSLMEMLQAVLELFAEALGTLFEAVAELLGSLFG